MNLNNINGISCYCATYGRPKSVIENSIQCFLEQKWQGSKELIIFNDCKYQEFIFDHPEIKIINSDTRIKKLGQKFNETVDFCQYDFLATWEDDDTFLNNRLDYSMNNLYKGLIFHTYDGFIEKAEKNISQTTGYFHSTHIFFKELFLDVGKYEEKDRGDIDVLLINKLKNKIGNYSQTTQRKNIFYIYSWLNNSYHTSSSNLEPGKISEQVEKQTLLKIDQGLIETGKIYLEPKLRYDFYQYIPDA
jgi:hypothetical protein